MPTGLALLCIQPQTRIPGPGGGQGPDCPGSDLQHGGQGQNPVGEWILSHQPPGSLIPNLSFLNGPPASCPLPTKPSIRSLTMAPASLLGKPATLRWGSAVSLAVHRLSEISHPHLRIIQQTFGACCVPGAVCGKHRGEEIPFGSPQPTLNTEPPTFLPLTSFPAPYPSLNPVMARSYF